MKTLLAIYLVFFKGYSVMKFSDLYLKDYGYVFKKYGACNSELDFDYTHAGTWGDGDTMVEAIIDCYKKTKPGKMIGKKLELYDSTGAKIEDPTNHPIKLNDDLDRDYYKMYVSDPENFKMKNNPD